ncbi:MAG: SRPBCC family protein [Thaumarchaeota archaeon]|nr:SRPBCC family protein [Nitrososphaerota archaeon]
MAEIEAKIQIDASQDKIWKIISEVDNDPQYWKSMTRIRNISKERGVINREVYLGEENKCHQRVTLFPKEGVHISWLKGPITGIKDIMLFPCGNGTILEVQMKYEPSGIMRFFFKNGTNYFQKEAELALQLIKEKSDGTGSKGPKMEIRKMWADLAREKR